MGGGGHGFGAGGGTHLRIRSCDGAPWRSSRSWAPPAPAPLGTANKDGVSEGRWAGDPPPRPPPPPITRLTFGRVPAGPMGFIMVYMFSLELVESVGSTRSGRGARINLPPPTNNTSPPPRAHSRAGGHSPPGLGMMGVPGGPPPPGGPYGDREEMEVGGGAHGITDSTAPPVPPPYSPRSSRGMRRSRRSRGQEGQKEGSALGVQPPPQCPFPPQPRPPPHTYRVGIGVWPRPTATGTPGREWLEVREGMWGALMLLPPCSPPPCPPGPLHVHGGHAGAGQRAGGGAHPTAVGLGGNGVSGV